jgi:hypothetical protein
VGAGLVLNALALRDYEMKASQQSIPEINQSIQRLDIASVVCYAVGVVAGAAWGAAVLRSDPTPAVTATVASSGSGLTFGLAGRF